MRRALRKTPQGKKWHPYQVRELLVAPRNAALRIDGDKEYKGAWPEIVDPAIWRATVDISEDPSRRKGVDRGRKHLLSGLARFGRCGPNSPPRSTIAASANSCITCGKIVRNGDKVDELVIERVVWRLSREDAVDLLRLSVDPVDANALRAERKRLREQLTQLGKDFATAPPEFTKAALDDVNGRLAEIDTKLSDPQGQGLPGRPGAKDVRNTFLGLDLGRRRTIVDAHDGGDQPVQAGADVRPNRHPYAMEGRRHAIEGRRRMS